MKKLFTLLGVLLSVLTAFGQNINFVVEKGELFTLSGDPIRSEDNTVDQRENFSVWAGFAQGSLLSNFESGVADFKSTSDVETLNSTLGSISWTSVPLASGLLSGTQDYRLSDEPGNIGDTPLLLISSSDGFNNLTASDQVGLVGSTTEVIELATLSVTFNGGDQWDTEYLGTLGSLTLQAVPEPSTFALIAGCFGLAFAMVRRRV